MQGTLHTVRQERGGAVVEIAPHAGLARIATQGAQLLSWRPAGQAHDVLWCSSLSPLGGGKAIRGGVPVCWPWFGPHAEDAKRPQHGFARNLDWHFDGTSQSPRRFIAGFSLNASASVALERLKARLTFCFDVNGTLNVQLTTTNMGPVPAPLSPVLHTYFAVSDVAAITIEGLDGATYRDNTRAGAKTRQNGPMRITGETIALFDDAPSRQVIVDPGLPRRITIDRAGAGSTIVWNPGANAASMADIPAGEAARFVCVESGIIGERALTLAAGASHTLDVSIAVVPQA